MARGPVFLDHLTIWVSNLDRSRRFYRAALEPLGARTIDVPGPPETRGPAVVLGPVGAEDLVLVEGQPTSPLHLAFVAADAEAVDRFHAAALASGGRDNGSPGIRERYHPQYYAAYVLDPDGHNVEAVFHGPEPRMTQEHVEQWVEGYLTAWRSNSPADIEALFTPEATYFTAPHRRPWRGHREIVEGWLERAPQQGEWSFRHDILDVIGDTAYVRGWTAYEDGVIGNLWVIRFAEDRRCWSFTEWWMSEEA
jgi:catechol 2,3-dioxygenase-like lactoylglutathione lyase family enzyme